MTETLIVLMAGLTLALADQPQSSSPGCTASASIEPASNPIVTTHHQVTIHQRTLSYSAHAGLLPIRHNETGEIHGHMFFVAYLLDRSTKEPARPLTFLWNGGPGANSTLVHLSAFGPRRIRSKRGPAGPPDGESELVDNQETWLDLTDLVFVDPIGTGFSRPTKAEYGAEFFNTLGDIASVAEFVRVYLTRFDAWDAPLIIGGESYGVWRAAGVAEALARSGRKVAGLILISGGLPVGRVVPDNMRTALFVPTRTAAAFFHKKLPPDLQTDLASALDTRGSLARTEYAPALGNRDKLGEPERQNILAQLARFSGLAKSLIDPKTLVVSRQQFAEQLLREQKQVLGRYDTRQTATAEKRAFAGRGMLINKYLRSTLQFKTDLAYQGVEEGYSPVITQSHGRPLSVGERWNYNQGPPVPPGTPPNSDAPPGGHQPWLRRAIAIDPSLKALVCVGLFDSLNSCAGMTYLVNQLEPELKRNITVKCYEAGHMIYESEGPRKLLKQDVRKFIQDIAAAARKTP